MTKITSRKLSSAALAVALIGTTMTYFVTKEELAAPLVHRNLRSRTSSLVPGRIHVPSTLDAEGQRHLSLDLGGGNCKWQPPVYDVPDDVDFHKTLIAGFPSGDKRMIFVQMEALTGWPAKDEWDFEFLGMSNNPFIKANYPHHEGIWGWGDAADQMVLMIRNMRRSMVEYHDILWDIDYAKTWEEATLALDQLYGERPPIEDFLVWRDDRVMDEIHWYGWEIDYWMEGGLLRDMFTHGITTAEHWAMTMNPLVHTRSDLEEFYADNVAPGVLNGVISPAYDANCANGFITDGCEPVAVLSAEKLRDYEEGPAETEAIANVLLNDERTGQYVIAQEAWDCVWEELIMNGKGLKTVVDRPGMNENDYNFSEEMLDAMIAQLDRLIAKYGGSEWSAKPTANRVVELLSEHRALIAAERDEVASGARVTTERDFLGPEERRRRALAKGDVSAERDEGKMDYTKYFNSVWQRVSEKRDVGRREAILAEARSRMDDAAAAGEMEEFLQSLLNVVARIRMLQDSGKADQSTVLLLEQVEKVVERARPMVAASSKI